MSRRFVLSLVAALPALSLALAQNPGPFNERDVKKQPNVKDRSDTWVLDFRFKDPRLITVDIPGRGKRVVWYMWYQVINNTGEPRTFYPDFELVTTDKNTVHHDAVIPKAQEAIRRIEDPTGYLDIKNSVTIARQAIPVTKPESTPRAVTGVAIWDDIFGDMPDTTRFSIFVSGLSNGWSRDDNNVVRRKTLQLNFKRLSDRNHLDTEVKFISPAEWIYRAMTPQPKAKDKPKEKDKE
jgi:hypothetical protein